MARTNTNSGSGSSGVTSLNGLLGALSIVAGSGITITPSGTTITISNTGSGGGPASPVNSVQYNNAGAFGGNSNFIYDGSGTLSISGYGLFGNGALINIGIGGSQIRYDGSGNFVIDGVGGQELAFVSGGGVNLQDGTGSGSGITLGSGNTNVNQNLHIGSYIIDNSSVVSLDTNNRVGYDGSGNQVFNYFDQTNLQFGNGSTGLTVDVGTGTTIINSLFGVTQMSVSDSTGIQQLGDIGFDRAGNTLYINGPAKQISFTQELVSNGVMADFANHHYYFGDFALFNSGTYLDVNDNSGVLAGIGYGGTRNAFNLDFIGQSYILGEFSGTNATFVQLLNSPGTSTFVSYGNVLGNGLTGVGLGIDYIGGQYGIGDLSLLNNQTFWYIDDTNSQFYVNGMKVITPTIIPFTGTGLDDLTWGGSYSGLVSNNYNVWIVSIGNWIINYTSETGVFNPGDTVDNSVSGGTATATVVSDDGAGTLIVTGTTGGIWNVGDTVTDSMTSDTLVSTAVTNNPDTFAFQDTLGNSALAVVITGSPQPLSFGVEVVFGSLTGHDLGASPTPGPFLGWEEDITVAFGRMIVADGQNGIIKTGDVSSIGNGTLNTVDDKNQLIKNKGTLVEPSIHNQKYSGTIDYSAGFKGLSQLVLSTASGATNVKLPSAGTLVEAPIGTLFTVTELDGLSSFNSQVAVQSLGATIDDASVAFVYGSTTFERESNTKWRTVRNGQKGVVIAHNAVNLTNTTPLFNYVVPALAVPSTYQINAYINAQTIAAGGILQIQVIYTDEFGVVNTIALCVDTSPFASVINTAGNHSFMPKTIRARQGTTIVVTTVSSIPLGTLYDAGASLLLLS